MNIRLILSGLAACAALCATPGTGLAQIFETNLGNGTIGEYTTSGATVNAALVSGLNNTPTFIDVVAVPEPSIWSMIGVGGVALLGIMCRKKHRTA